MSYLPLRSLRSPQLDIDNAPIKTFALGYNALPDSFKAPLLPSVFLKFPRATQTANQNYIGRYMLRPETQNYTVHTNPSWRICQSHLRRFLSETSVASSAQCFLSTNYR
jgi:hypothetical protein